jgi:hypothetical protein
MQDSALHVMLTKQCGIPSDFANFLCHFDFGDIPYTTVMSSMDLWSRAILPHGAKTVVKRGRIGYYRPLCNVSHCALKEDLMRRQSR